MGNAYTKGKLLGGANFFRHQKAAPLIQVPLETAINNMKKIDVLKKKK